MGDGRNKEAVWVCREGRMLCTDGEMDEMPSKLEVCRPRTVWTLRRRTERRRQQRSTSINGEGPIHTQTTLAVRLAQSLSFPRHIFPPFHAELHVYVSRTHNSFAIYFSKLSRKCSAQIVINAQPRTYLMLPRLSHAASLHHQP